jgi:hypothetical protein
LLDENGQLGLHLFYLETKMSVKYLCMLFGITPSTCCRYINKLMNLIVKQLKNNQYARPSGEKMNEFAQMIALREPTAYDVIGFMDGVSLACECESDGIQNSYYNGDQW